jgi:ABC-type glycerol-3-phosphate transport system substrate-binding protein
VAALLFVVLLGLAACGQLRRLVAAPAASTERPRRLTITLVTHDSFAVSKPVLARVHEADRDHGEDAAGTATPAPRSTR